MAKRAKDIQRKLDFARLQKASDALEDEKQMKHLEEVHAAPSKARESTMKLIAEEVVLRYKNNLQQMQYGTVDGIMANALKYTLDVRDSVIIFNLTTGNIHFDQVLKGMEYGTGVYGPNARPIVPKHSKYLKFPIYGTYTHLYRQRSGEKLAGQKTFVKNGWVYTTATKGVKPGFMMTKAMKSVYHDYENQLKEMDIGLEVFKGNTNINEIAHIHRKVEQSEKVEHD